MTTTSPVTPTRGPADPAAGRHAGFANLLQAEWTKIRSVRSTVWTLLIFVVVCVGLTALIAWLTESHWNGPRAASRDARVIADPVGFILGTGVGLGQLAICVLGVLVITSEYSTGSSAPRCWPSRAGYRCWPPRRWCWPLSCSS